MVRGLLNEHDYIEINILRKHTFYYTSSHL